MVEGRGKITLAIVLDDTPILMMTILVGNPRVQQQIPQKEIVSGSNCFAERLPVRRKPDRWVNQ